MFKVRYFSLLAAVLVLPSLILSAPGFWITKPPVVPIGGPGSDTGPPPDPNALDGQWFRDAATGAEDYLETEFYDNEDGMGGGFAFTFAIQGVVTFLRFTGPGGTIDQFNLMVTITNDMVKKAGNLKIISCATTGSDHIEREELDKRSIPVRTLKEDRDLLLDLTPAAELSWALLTACARILPAAFDHVKSGQWVRESFPGIMLKGKQLGIIGCGRIGGWMGRYARAFDMKIVGYDPYLDRLPEGFSRIT